MTHGSEIETGNSFVLRVGGGPRGQRSTTPTEGRAYTVGERSRPLWLFSMPSCRTYPEKMATIDRLVHALHVWARGTFTFPAAHNLIEGSRQDVFHLLEQLAYGDTEASHRSDSLRLIAESPEVTCTEGLAFEALDADLRDRLPPRERRKLRMSIDAPSTRPYVR